MLSRVVLVIASLFAALKARESQQDQYDVRFGVIQFTRTLHYDQVVC